MFFRSVHATARPLPETRLQDLLGEYEKDSASGLIQASSSGDTRVALIIFKGRISSAYFISTDSHEHITVGRAVEIISGFGAGTLTSARLPALALRAAKIQSEQPQPAETLKVTTERLHILLDQWKQLPHFSLAALTWPTAEGLILLPGYGITPRQGLFMSDGVHESTEAISRMNSWFEETLDAARYPYSSEVPAWEEYITHRSFVAILEAVLNRYKELTGLALLNALGRAINRIANENRWDVSIVVDRVNDQEIFPGIADMVGAYRILLAVTYNHVASVLGEKLLQTVHREALADVDALTSRTVLKYALLSGTGFLTARQTETDYA
jgi:hypothetical protein